MPSLKDFNQTMRPYQDDVVHDALGFVRQSQEDLDLHARRLYALPTGTGKGSIQLMLLKTLRDAGVNAWLLSPALDVLRSALSRCGADSGDLERASAAKLAKMGEEIYTTTPLRYERRILDGEYDCPEVVIYDEAHHAIDANETSGSLFSMFPDAVWLGFTATPYRGTPQGTKELRDSWGEPRTVLTIPEAIFDGYMSKPRFRIEPLVDDDKIKVRGGEFNTASATRVVKDRAAGLAELIRDTVYPVAQIVPRMDMPTVVMVPGIAAAGALVEELDELGVSARMVVGSTKPQERALAYRECQELTTVIVSVNVLQEGVDFPWLGRLVDAKPTLSPVAWIQRIGRIMRPKDFTPEYLCVCRNLERWSYLMGGAVPPEVVAEAQEAFQGPTSRAGARGIGWEALSKFKPINVPLRGGLKGSMFLVYSMDETTGTKTDWCILQSPLVSTPVVARKDTPTMIDDEGNRVYDSTAKWRRAVMPSDLAGFATSQERRSLSPKQRQWWERSAERYGLDGNAGEYLVRRQFQALPVLSQTKINIMGVR